MNLDVAQSSSSPFVRHPREIAAAVTLPVAAAVLVAPGTALLDAAGRSAVATACAALATRMALVRFIGAASGPDLRAVRPFDPFTDPTPSAFHGRGPAPSRDRIRTAGARCTAVWHGWKQQGSPRDERRGVAGAVALGAWCSWAVGALTEAEVRAGYALDVVPDDALALVVHRSARAGARPEWWG